MLDDATPWLLISRYCAGVCTADEQASLESWIAGDSRRRLLVERLRTTFDDTARTPTDEEIELAWIKLAATIKQT